jgi:hypothetical protein
MVKINSMHELITILRQTRLLALVSVVLAVLFWIFFDACKHNPALAAAGVFLEDPYDAVGSFGIQLAGLAAMLALLRAFRPYSDEEDRLAMVLRGSVVCLSAILVTLVADGIALLRFFPHWTTAPSGWILAALTTGFLVITLFAGGWVFRSGRSFHLISSPEFSWPALGAILLAGLFLAFFPDAWRENILGGIFAALSGMALLFLVSFSIVRWVFPIRRKPTEDVLDDLAAFYAWMRAHARRAGLLFDWIEAISTHRWVRRLTGWLNPRNSRWVVVILFALGMGLLLILLEATGEGLPEYHRIILVFSVNIEIEGAGVLLGYALFNRYLGLIVERRPG